MTTSLCPASALTPRVHTGAAATSSIRDGPKPGLTAAAAGARAGQPVSVAAAAEMLARASLCWTSSTPPRSGPLAAVLAAGDEGEVPSVQEEGSVREVASLAAPS